MKKILFVIAIVFLATFSLVADEITVELMYVAPTGSSREGDTSSDANDLLGNIRNSSVWDHGDGSRGGMNYDFGYTNSKAAAAYWQRATVMVVVKKNDEIIRTETINANQNLSSDLNNLAGQLEVLYDELAGIQETIDGLDTQIRSGESNYDDVAKLQQLACEMTSAITDYNNKTDEINTKEDEIKTENGSGNPGWFYGN